MFYIIVAIDRSRVSVATELLRHTSRHLVQNVTKNMCFFNSLLIAMMILVK